MNDATGTDVVHPDPDTPARRPSPIGKVVGPGLRLAHPTDRLIVILLMVVVFIAAGPVFARNPLAGVFSRLLDETKSELAVGTLLADAITDTYVTTPPASSPALNDLCTRIGQRSTRNSLPYTVLVIETDEVLEVPLPGGAIALSRPVVTAASTPAALEFLLARNVSLIADRQPIMLIKSHGLYASLLRQAKTVRARRQPEQVGELLSSYLESLGHMNHAQADRQGLLLCQEAGALGGAVGLLNWWREQLATHRPLAVPGIDWRLQSLQTAGR
jgi:hypothetical protein